MKTRIKSQTKPVMFQCNLLNMLELSFHQWTVPQLSIMIIYNCTWSMLIQWITVILSGDNLTQKLQKKAYFLFVINLITRPKTICRMGRSLQICGTFYYILNGKPSPHKQILNKALSLVESSPTDDSYEGTVSSLAENRHVHCTCDM